MTFTFLEFSNITNRRRYAQQFVSRCVHYLLPTGETLEASWMPPNFLFQIEMLFQWVSCNCALCFCEYFFFILRLLLKRILQGKSLVHDKDLNFEARIEKRFKKIIKILNKINIKLNKIDIKLNKINIKLNKVNIKLNKNNIKLHKINNKFNKINIKFNKIDNKFNKINIKLNKINIKLNNINIKFNKINIKFNKINIKFN